MVANQIRFVSETSELRTAVLARTGPIPGRTDGETGDNMAVRFGDTWT